jgi:hypothetical protein
MRFLSQSIRIFLVARAYGPVKRDSMHADADQTEDWTVEWMGFLRDLF